MLPLRFPNRPLSTSPSGSRIQGYTISLGSEEEGWPTTASLHARPADHDQAVAKAPGKGVVVCAQGQPAREAGAIRRGSCPQGRPVPLAVVALAGTTGCDQLAGATAAHGHNRLQRGTRKGGRLQGARKGLPPTASTAASRGGGVSRRGGCQRARAAAACAAEVAAAAA
ncbi:hypothetical protein GW17_00057586 [Ensete ventricosum]|nr:hypothetical protein GW17_00057586 [Ensete ventricosum]